MSDHLSALARRMAELERKLDASFRQGVVAEVDPANGTVRLDLGDGMLSPHIPFVQTAGALKVHSPPSVGQLMVLSAPSGETEQGFATPLSFGGGNDPPSTAGNENVVTFGSVRIELVAGGLKIAVGGTTVEVTAGGVAITGGTVTHNGKNIGSTHKHGGVDRGGSNTDEPN